MIIGLGGDQHAGKSTLADAFAKIEPELFHIETWHPIGEVADEFHKQMPVPPEQNDIIWMNKWLKVLPAIVSEVVHTDCRYDQVRFEQEDVDQHPAEYEKFYLHSVNLVKNPELAQHKITEENKPLYRPILQFLGAHLVKNVQQTIWYDEIYRRVNLAQEDGSPDATIGGVRYKSDYESVHGRGGIVLRIIRPDMPAKDANDPTERERNLWTPDITVYNNGDIEDLLTLAPVLWEDLKQNKPQSVYLAKH